MSTSQEREKAEAWNNIAHILKMCGPEGSATLEIRAVEHKPSSTGIACHIEVNVWEQGPTGAPEPMYWLTRNLATYLGCRFSKRETLIMGGYGYCRATQIASELSRKCGHPLRVQSVNFFGGPRGWYPQAPEVAKQA